MEEELRECACNGDLDGVRKLLGRGVNVNSQHSINGWTPLHWAAKRGHASIIRQLVTHGADVTMENDKGQTAIDVASNQEVVQLLGGNAESFPKQEQSNGASFVPAYLSNPPFPYLKSSQSELPSNDKTQSEDQHSVRAPANETYSSQRSHEITHTREQKPPVDNEEIVLKVRVANAIETDFYEVELSRDSMTYGHLQELLCRELNVRPQLVAKIRKLPDTVIRKDKDVQRLRDFTELELVLSNKYVSESSRNYKPSVQPRSEDIVY